MVKYMQGVDEMSETRRCNTCKKIKELNEINFGKKRTGKSGFDSQCKECKKEYDKKRYKEKRDEILLDKEKYYEKNKVDRLKYQSEYYSKHKEKCKKSNSDWQRNKPTKRRLINSKSRTLKNGAESTLIEYEWLKIKRIFKNSCAYCGMTEEQSLDLYGERLHHEHVIPLIDNGGYVFGNVVPSCRSCNSSKANNVFGDWYPKSDVYNKEREEIINRYLNKS